MTGRRSSGRCRNVSNWLGMAVVAVSISGIAPLVRGDEASDTFFETKVRPILAERCFKCHGPTAKPKGGLRLDSRAAVLAGGDTGPAAVAGKPGESLLIGAIRYIDEPRMPPSGKLSEQEVDVLTRWVESGLPWPNAAVASPPASPRSAPSPALTEEQKRFWSFQPIVDQPPPRVRDAAWPRADLDRHILAALEAKGLRPAPEADRRLLIRRVTYDLTGLPPTPDDVEAFVADARPDAYERVVDRLLASPRHGQRWGRHWLDLVRYTDSFDARIAGSNNVMDINDSWRYRDWVVDALNRDLPYDRFLMKQIAGDVLGYEPDADASPVDGIVATGLLAIGNWGGGDADKEKLLTDIADDQVDVVSRAFMGLTLACARCHDHKFDPLTQRDYYGLAGIFFSTHILPNVGPKTNGPPMLRIPLESPEDRAARERNAKDLATTQAAIDRLREKARADLSASLRPDAPRYVVEAWARYGGGSAGRETKPVLRDYAVRQWAAALGLRRELALLDKTERDVRGKKGLHAWRGAEDTPSALINTTAEDVPLLTFKVPARGVTIHPGPSRGIVVEWTSPVVGTVAINGTLADADPAAGDGVAFALDATRVGPSERLASGQFDNGGKGTFSSNGVKVEKGSTLRLTVLPRASHTCDTTVVALRIQASEGAEVWDLAADLAADPLAGNPHADSRGRAGVWRFGKEGDSADVGPTEARARDVLERLARVVANRASTRPEVEAAASAFARDFQGYGKFDPFLPRGGDDSDFDPSAREELARLRAELGRLRKETPPPVGFANGALEGGVPESPHAGVHDVKVHIRGSYSRLGDLVPRRFPVILAGDEQPRIQGGSGRLELARWLARGDHPLTTRVIANRVWQHHFGAGLVRTPSNFGKLGEPPTHPALLDHLATLLVREGWSLKRLHRAILLSSTYRQSSEADPRTQEADPDNRLFGRMNRRRLDAESVRDSLLQATGRLEETMGGPAYRDPAVPRRTLYLMTIRSDRSNFGALFDAADPTAMVDARVVSTVAPQALYLLNNDFVLQQARALARRVEREAPASDDARLARLHALLYGRSPTTDELAIGRGCLDRFASRAGGRAGAWDTYCHVLLCTNEWIYLD